MADRLDKRFSAGDVLAVLQQHGTVGRRELSDLVEHDDPNSRGALAIVRALRDAGEVASVTTDWGVTTGYRLAAADDGEQLVVVSPPLPDISARVKLGSALRGAVEHVKDVSPDRRHIDLGQHFTDRPLADVVSVRVVAALLESLALSAFFTVPLSEICLLPGSCLRWPLVGHSPPAVVVVGALRE